MVEEIVSIDGSKLKVNERNEGENELLWDGDSLSMNAAESIIKL